MKGIRIYAEGGGDGQKTRALFRTGLSQFLVSLKNLARSKGIDWDVVACGPRHRAFTLFKNAIRDHMNAFNILLVDSEGPLQSTSVWGHLYRQDGWDKPAASDENCHLMVQAMEAWFIADIEALKSFYGTGFNANALPGTDDVETIEKSSLEPSLKAASRNTTKGEYHKTHHAYKLLARLDESIVRKKAPHCHRLFETLAGMME